MRTLLWMSGIVVIVSAILGAGSLWAENKDKSKPRTRIGLLNLTYVIKEYHKYKTFEEDAKDIVVSFQPKDAKLRSQLEKLRVEAEKLVKESSNGEESAAQLQKKKDALETKARQLQRELEDNTFACKYKLAKRSDDKMKLLYADVHEAVKEYAKKHDLDVVLHYNEPVVREEYYSAQHLVNKYQSGGLMSITCTPGIDISKEIIELLNLGPRKKS